MSIAPTDPEILARAESTKVCIAGLHKFFDELRVLRGVDHGGEALSWWTYSVKCRQKEPGNTS